jgi:putative aldouronate transport system permease protein
MVVHVKSLTQQKIRGVGAVKEWMVALRRDKYFYLMAAPGLLYILVFKYLPIWGIVLAFKDYSPYLGFWESKWVGFKYFEDLFTNPDFFLLFRNTMVISILNLVFFFPMPILVALMLNEVGKVKFKKWVQTAIYLPHFISWVVIVGICYIMLSQSDGIINKLIAEFGGKEIAFLTKPEYFWAMITAQSIWKEAGWGTILFLAALTGINPDLYEAAQIDGASRWKQAFYITLPGIKSTIIVLLILRLGTVLETGFEHIYLMSNNIGPLASVADVFDTYAYRNGVQNGRFSYATAVGVFKSVVGLILIIGANRLAKRMGEEGVY